MSEQGKRVIGAAAVTGLLLTLLVALWPVTTAGVSCGNAVHTSDEAAVSDLTGAMTADASGDTLSSLSPAEDACSSALSSRRLMAGVLLVITLVAAGYRVSASSEVKPADA